jgi:NAD-dependent dihydropyrimidine dehydrogenase PreA subunit
MIELISNSRCTGCDICVKICPTNVFDPGEGDAPTIARQQDCQTCFMCEAYCPADALYVAPESSHSVPVDEHELSAAGRLGEYRVLLGWGPGRTSNSERDTAHLLRTLPGPFRR